MHHFKTVNFSIFKITLVEEDSGVSRWSRTGEILKVKIFTVLKQCIPDKFRLQKFGVTKGFFKVKVLSDFDFGQFLRNWSQHHLVGKLLQVQKLPGDYQYVSLVCKTHSNSQEDFFDSFSFWNEQWAKWLLTETAHILVVFFQLLMKFPLIF